MVIKYVRPSGTSFDYVGVSDSFSLGFFSFAMNNKL